MPLALICSNISSSPHLAVIRTACPLCWRKLWELKKNWKRGKREHATLVLLFCPLVWGAALSRVACQHQYLTATSCCVAVATKVCTSRSLHTGEFTGLQHLSHLSRCFHVYCSSPQDPAPLLQKSAEVPMWQILVEEMSLSFPGMRPLIITVHRVAKLDQPPSSPFSPTKPWSGSTSPPSSELIHPILLSTCRPVWLHLSSSFLSSVMLFDSAQELPFFCPLYQCHFSSLSLCLSSCMWNTALEPLCSESRCSLFHFPSRWLEMFLCFFPPLHTSLSVQYYLLSRAPWWRVQIPPTQTATDQQTERLSFAFHKLSPHLWSRRCWKAQVQVVSSASLVFSPSRLVLSPVLFLQPGGGGQMSSNTKAK